MKRLLILLILLFASPAYAQQCSEDTPCPEVARLSPAMMGSTPVAGTSCTLYVQDTNAGDATGVDPDDYWGQGDWYPATNQTICKVRTNFQAITESGNVVVSIFTMSGTSLGSLLGSVTKAYTGITTGWNDWEFSPSVAVVSGGATKYAITVSATNVDVPSLVVYDSASPTLQGGFMHWESDKTLLGDYTGTYGACMAIWTDQ